MHETFIEPVQANYLANITMSKKVEFLENQLNRSQNSNKTLSASMKSINSSVDKLIANRTNHQILVTMQKSIQQYEQSLKECNKIIKSRNATVLIQEQLRHQERIDGLLKIRQLELQIDSMRVRMREKDQQYTIILMRLKKYEDIKQQMVKQKLQPYEKKLAITQKDKDQIMKQLIEQLGKYKKIVNEKQVDIDQKIQVLLFNLKEGGYQQMVEEFKSMISTNHEELYIQDNHNKKVKKDSYKSYINPSNLWASIQNIGRNSKSSKNQILQKTEKSSSSYEIANKQLIKQLKKCLLGNNLLEKALNKSIQRNEQLLTYNQILVESNLDLKERLDEYKRLQLNVGIFKSSQNKKVIQLKGNNKLPNNHLGKQIKTLKKVSSLENLIDGGSDELDYQNQCGKRTLQKYLKQLRSDRYEVNTIQLQNDVKKMGQFLILSVSKNDRKSLLTSTKSISAEKIHPSSEQSKKVQQNNISNKISLQKNRKNEDDFEIVQY